MTDVSHHCHTIGVHRDQVIPEDINKMIQSLVNSKESKNVDMNKTFLHRSITQNSSLVNPRTPTLKGWICKHM